MQNGNGTPTYVDEDIVITGKLLNSCNTFAFLLPSVHCGKQNFTESLCCLIVAKYYGGCRNFRLKYVLHRRDCYVITY